MADILLVGTGFMGKEYAKVLHDMKHNTVAIGRGEDSAKAFTDETGITAKTGGIDAWLDNNPQVPSYAIICTDEASLAASAEALLKRGVRDILVEKPGGLTEADIHQLGDKTAEAQANVHIAYNRRFYASTQKALQMIEEDGGAQSFHFEFTEWVHRISDELKKGPVGSHWFLANSTHVIDMAFFMGGHPQELHAHVRGGFDWHPAGAQYVGEGISERGALFSYRADWNSAGRWWVEVMTPKRKIIFRPLETLKTQAIGSVQEEEIPLEDDRDTQYKAGIWRQVESFLSDKHHLPSIAEHVDMMRWYKQINGGVL